MEVIANTGVSIQIAYEGIKLIGSGFICTDMQSGCHVVITTAAWCSELVKYDAVQDNGDTNHLANSMIYSADWIINPNITIITHQPILGIYQIQVGRIRLEVMNDALKCLTHSYQHEISHHHISLCTVIICQILNGWCSLFPSSIPLPCDQLLPPDHVVYVMSCPFGNQMTCLCLNSLSCGYLKESLDDKFYMTRVKLVDGCVGGMVIIKTLDHGSEYRLLGLVVHNDVQSSYNIVISSKFISDIAECNIVKIPNDGLYQSNSSVECVVSVTCGDTTGSGVIVSSHIVMTCAHVIRYHHKSPIIIHYRGTKTFANVLYSSSNQLDIAILLLSQPLIPSGLVDLTATTSDIYNSLLGDDVTAMGYKVNDAASSLPHITHGILSKIVRSSDDDDIMLLQSTAPLYNGMSGGLLTHWKSNTPLGLLQFNLKDKTSSLVYNYISFAIPLFQVLPLVLKFVCDEDSNCLKQLEYRYRKVPGEANGVTSRL